MHAFSYARSLPVTWERWQLHHSICRTRQPHTACRRYGSMFDRTVVNADGSFIIIAGIGIFDLFVSCDVDLHKRTQPVDRGDMPHVQIWTSYVKTIESYRLTDRETDRHHTTKIIYHTASRVVNKVTRFHGSSCSTCIGIHKRVDAAQSLKCCQTASEPPGWAVIKITCS